MARAGPRCLTKLRGGGSHPLGAPGLAEVWCPCPRLGSPLLVGYRRIEIASEATERTETGDFAESLDKFFEHDQIRWVLL